MTTYETLENNLKKSLGKYLEESKVKTSDQLPPHRRPQVQTLEVVMSLLDLCLQKESNANIKETILKGFIHIVSFTIDLERKSSLSPLNRSRLRELLMETAEIRDSKIEEKINSISKARSFYNSMVFEDGKAKNKRVKNDPFSTIKGFADSLKFEESMIDLQASLCKQEYDKSKNEPIEKLKNSSVWSYIPSPLSFWSRPSKVNHGMPWQCDSKEKIDEDYSGLSHPL